jgi:hypothetical protein
MVIRSSPSAGRRERRQRGSLSVELTVAVGILVTVLMPLSVSFAREQALVRDLYHRAVAIALVDGETEVLQAGEWRRFPPGTHTYTLHARAVTNLPPGRLTFTLTTERARLEWQPEAGGGGPVVREFPIRPEATNAPGSTP